MKSIRRSLIVYVLLLLTVALGAVSWFSYGTTAHSLRERQRDSEKLIVEQCESKIRAARSDLDQRVLEQARTMARTARSTTVHTDGQATLGFIVWAAQGIHPPVPYQVIREVLRTPFKQLALIDDDLVADPVHERGQEYYQTYMPTGLPIQRSESLGDQKFVLDEALQKKAIPLQEYFDDVNLDSGVKVRRVTLKAPVSRQGGFIPTPFPRFGFRGGWKTPPPKGQGKDGPKDPPPPAKGPPAKDFAVQPVFIQFACDIAPTEVKIAGFRKKRDEQLGELAQTIDTDLAQLRNRMLWIGLASLAALWLGGYLVICLGLAPLSKMSDAVSRVSPKDFHLPLKADTLPDELQPIAATLAHTLEQLRKAFEREKQAAADMSHELRTPLAALMTTLEVALRKSRSAEEYREILEECRASGQHMYQLVERLLTLARLDAGADQYHPAHVDVIEIALACADLIRPLARARGLEMRLNVPDPIAIQTDPNKLREVLTNLLHNAVEYNKPNGSIELSVERANGHVRFEVRDTGIGIKPEAIEHLFKRFFRADPSRHADTPHAGLGLSIVKSYVELMGGAIKVDSSEAGTTFTVELPFIEALPAETGIQAAPEFARG
jgi:signal transduction histidine kinase